ncbi:MAG: hypothetical protein J6D12_02340, partial [Peptostreptococcaceae bacterium]|nr:hypothetical protein [Peptostreptococcaceae bacterium]
MNWDDNNIENIVEYINNELKTRTMVDIEVNDFKVNDRVIVKRLTRRGYKRIDGFYVKVNEYSAPKKKVQNNKVIPQYNQSTTKVQQEFIEDITNESNNSITTVIPPSEVALFKEIDLKSLKELTELVEPIKLLVKQYNSSITKENIIEVEPIEVVIDKSKFTGEVKPVGFKL